MQRKEFEKFLFTEAFQCPQCKRKNVAFASKHKKDDEITSPIALLCLTCTYIWNHTFHDYSHQAEELKHEKK